MTRMERAHALHPDVRRKRNLGIAAGIIATLVGMTALILQLRGPGVWLITLIIFGPILIFGSALAASTYLEEVDEEDAFPAVYRDQPSSPPPRGAL